MPLMVPPGRRLTDEQRDAPRPYGFPDPGRGRDLDPGLDAHDVSRNIRRGYLRTQPHAVFRREARLVPRNGRR